MRRLTFIALVFLLGCGDNPGPTATDGPEVTPQFAKGGPKTMLLTGEMDFKSGAAYLNETGQALLWRLRTADFAVKADGSGIYSYTRYESDGVQVNGEMKIDVMCGGSQGEFAAVVGPIVRATGGYETNLGRWFIAFVKDGGTPGRKGDLFRGNYTDNFDSYDSNDPEGHACALVQRLTDGNPGNDTEPQDWVVARYGDGSRIEDTCEPFESFTYDGQRWPSDVAVDMDLTVTCTVGGWPPYPIWHTQWPPDQMAPALAGNIKVY